MVLLPRRAARVKQLVKSYTLYNKYNNMRKQQRSRRILRLKELLYTSGLQVHSAPGPFNDLSGTFSANSDSSSSDGSSSSDSSGGSANFLQGADWFQPATTHWSASSISSATDISGRRSLDLGDIDSDNSESIQSEDSDIAILEQGLDNLNEDMEDLDEEYHGQRSARIRRWVQEQMVGMYASRYEMDRDTLPRGPSYLHHVLTVLKSAREDQFRLALRVTPPTFDALVAKIADDEVFTNNSNNSQMPVDEQLAIALYRFGHDGNAASLQAVANWAGVAKGTVVLATRRVLTALLRPSFMDEAVRFPTPEEKEEAKEWVESHSCKAWRGGWCMVDGTLVPLADKPTWFGESYFDRKCRYSLNVQVVSLPNLRIIDFSYGHVGSTHDSTAWEDTRLAQEHDTLLEDGEWVWADSAYPINTWIVAPYKKPDRDIEENAVFNNHVSMVRIRSEHAIGYLKGHFHSLKNLRIHITSRRRHVIATYWIAACIGVHSFALQCEEHERQEAGHFEEEWIDPFIVEGLDDIAGDDEDIGPVHRPHLGYSRSSRVRLEAAKACREKLKRRLFYHRLNQSRS